MEPFEGGPDRPSQNVGDRTPASRVTVMEITARLTVVFVIAMLIVAGGGVLMLGAPWQTLVTWGVLVFPLLLLNGVLLRKMNRNRHATLAARLSKLSVGFITTGAIGLSVLAAGISYFYCSTALSEMLLRR